MQNFSQRQGLKPLPEVGQTGGMNVELRNSLWNALDSLFWSRHRFMTDQDDIGIENFSRRLWANFFKQPVDERPGAYRSDRGRIILKHIREYFFACKWNEVYEFLEFVVRSYRTDRPRLGDLFNLVLEDELSGYRFVDGLVVDIVDPQEREMLAEALADTRFLPVAQHLSQALSLMADRKNPDHRNSIKESISAVEAMARIVSENSKATLGDALKVLEKSGHLHPALKDGFFKIYGYTNDSDGIRHAMLEETKLDQADSRYFLLSCTSFINYLKSRIA